MPMSGETHEDRMTPEEQGSCRSQGRTQGPKSEKKRDKYWAQEQGRIPGRQRGRPLEAKLQNKELSYPGYSQAGPVDRSTQDWASRQGGGVWVPMVGSEKLRGLANTPCPNGENQQLQGYSFL